MKRIALIALVFVLVLVTGGGLWFLQSPYHRIALWMATGVTAKQLCSLTFVSGLKAERAWSLYLAPQLRWATDLVAWDVDRGAAWATANVRGLYEQTAVYRDGLGCTLVRDEMVGLDSPLERSLRADNPLPPADATRYDPALINAALDRAFEEPETSYPGAARNTLAVVVLHEGRVIAERYAEGIEAETPLLGWSMAKSITTTLVGAMVQRGMVDLHAPGAVAAPADRPRTRDITLDQLLRMTSGLAIDERNDGTDPNVEMLFVTGDMAAFAASRDQRHEPGEVWSYMSGSTNLAMRHLQDRMGGDLGSQIAFIDEVLFAPLGVTTALFEPDAAGTLVGSSYLWASARDWARMGQLYLDGGRAGDVQLIPPDWIDYVTTRTEASEVYGSGFWLYRRSESMPQIFDMDGFQGQHAVIVPELNLVIVRLGATNFTSAGSRELVSDFVGVVHAAADTATDR
ncbi:MAG: serine hydrolase [Pseudomonadota bacterium]